MAKTARKPTSLDPDNISSRLYNQVSVLLGQLEKGTGVTIKERYMALAAIARIQAIFQAIRIKEGTDEPTAGSTVRKYTTAFSAHDARRRKELARDATDDLGADDLLGLGDDEDRDTA